MSKFGLKLLFVIILLGFGIFYGVDMATHGTEKLFGTDDELLVEEIEEQEEEMEERKERLNVTVDPKPPGVADRLGQGLQIGAQKVAELFVSMFELFL